MGRPMVLNRLRKWLRRIRWLEMVLLLPAPALPMVLSWMYRMVPLLRMPPPPPMIPPTLPSWMVTPVTVTVLVQLP